jgi:hypothetical protein
MMELAAAAPELECATNPLVQWLSSIDVLRRGPLALNGRDSARCFCCIWTGG